MLHYRLPARRSGSFGSAPLGAIAEAATLTWFRFELLLLWLIVVGAALAAASSPAAALAGTLVSPLTALALWVLLKLTGWLFYFVPGVNRLWGWGRVLFLTLFSRLVVEEAPTIELPAWSPHR